MRHYHARSIPAGTHTRNFSMLTKPEQKEKVKKLLASSMSRTAVSQLTGLTLPEIAAFADVP